MEVTIRQVRITDYTGNAYGPGYESTYCPVCGEFIWLPYSRGMPGHLRPFEEHFGCKHVAGVLTSPTEHAVRFRSTMRA